MDQYMRNVKVIEDAFEQIKTSTGITSIEEIVSAFIKSEEQNYSLFNYVNTLGSDTDQLEESNKEIKEQIDKIIKRGQLSDKEKENLKKEMEETCENLESEIEKA